MLTSRVRSSVEQTRPPPELRHPPTTLTRPSSQSRGPTLTKLTAPLADSGPGEDKHNAPLPEAPRNIAAEVQLIYVPYLERGCKLSHLPYKVVRCDTPGELARDAGGKKQSAEVREAVRKAERACMDVAAAELLAPAAEEE